MRLRPRALVPAVALAPLCAAFVASCGAADFDPQSKVNTVRIFASRADEPYAKPGDSVTIDVLAYDGRRTKPEPMTVYWLPFALDSSGAGTISGKSAWDALANTTSHAPSPKPMTAKTGTLAFPTARRMVTEATMTA